MGGAPSLPTANTPGYGSITRNGRTYVGCKCIIAFIEAGETLGLARGLIKSNVDIVQLTGNATASAGVHRLGAAFDVKQFSPEWVVIWREMGAAFWPRTGADWVNNEHGHGGIDCPHNALVAYQNVAYRRGYNGLGQAKSGPYKGQWGYGAKDPTFRPSVRRTWQQGIAWANTEAARLTAAKAAAPTPPPAPVEDEEMALLSKESQDWIESRMDAHDAYVLANLKATIGRQLAALSVDRLAAAVVANLPTQGGLTADDVKAALGEALAESVEVTGNLSVSPKP